MAFIASQYSFGQTEEPQTEETQPYWETLIAQYAPAIQTVAETAADPTQQVEVLQARIENLERTKQFSPALAPIIDKRLNVLYAKLSAAKIRKKKQMEQYRSRRAFRSLSQTAIVGGIATAAMLVIFLTAATRTQKSKQRVLEGK